MLADLKIIARDYWKIFIRPTPLTFASISYNAHGRLVLAMVIATLMMDAALLIMLANPANPIGSILLVAVFALFVIPLWMLLWAFFMYKICCNLFHRKKSDYESILYILLVVMTLSNVFPLIGIAVSSFSPVFSDVFTWASYIYILLLSAIGLYATARLRIWQSILTVLISGGLASAACFALIVFFAVITRTVPQVL